MRAVALLVLSVSLIIPLAGITKLASAQLAPLDPQAAFQDPPAGTGKISPEVQAEVQSLQEGEMMPVIVTLTDQADLSQIPGASRAARQQGVIRSLQAQAAASQKQIQAFLTVGQAQGKVGHITSFWVFNGLAVTATGDVIDELAARSDVQAITPDEIQIVPAQLPAPPEPNLSTISASLLWNLGVYGQGVVVANMDSGVDVSHPDLVSRWRGGSNSWFDPYGQHPTTPVDFSGHGTWTMGVMVGGDAGGTAVGLAPQAQWIAVKIFDDQGGSTATAIHQGFQWLLDPDSNPASADAPWVVNNSWTYAYSGCYLEFELDLQALRAAGIVPVFAAGNGGPGAGTSYSPANNPSAFAVGATNDSDLIYAYSSRGPSDCGGAGSIFPDVVAPGVDIHTTDLYGSYYDATGTSLAAPHAAGGLALLLSAFPNLSAAEQEAALIQGALDLGPVGPDNDFGHGRLDLFAAYQSLVGAPAPTPTATPDPNVNLALDRPVTASSSSDSAHDASMAVDGDPATTWQTAPMSGKNKLPTEWITVDLGTSLPVSRVILEWDAYYATGYSLQVSNDGSTWDSLFSTLNGDGGNDTISTGPVEARFVRLDSTAWNNSRLRNWLKGFEAYAGGGVAPTATPPPAPTATPMPTPTPTPGTGTTLHVGDLDGASVPGDRNRWDATVAVSVHDASERPVADATVFVTWSQGASGSDSCVTGADGLCSIAKANLKSSTGSVTLVVDSITHASLSYLAEMNHDPDGDSDGTKIVVAGP